MGDSNHGGMVYGFVTTGDSWRMLRCDGSFLITEKIEVVFDTMRREEGKQRWMRDFSIIVDCEYAALSDGSVAKQ